MTLIRIDEACLDYGDSSLLDHAELSIENGERVSLIGRNGQGKTSLLKILSGQVSLDSGKVWTKPHCQISQLQQELPNIADNTVYEVVAEGLKHLYELRDEYTKLTNTNPEGKTLKKLEQLQQLLDSKDAWHIDQKIESILSYLKLPGKQTMKTLSGGWRRRVLLGQALVSNPDLLLLDEPTNHLDIETIEWLEQQILYFSGSVLFITHDRSFLQSLATRIIELDRGKLTSWPGDYQHYLTKKEQLLEEEKRHNAEFDKKLAQEEVWVRQGIKARRTRNEGRVRALKKLRETYAQRRKTQGSAKFQLEQADQSGYRVIEAHNVCYHYGEKKLIDKFSTKIIRGDRIGLIGNNGAGKSTLLKLLLGELKPQQGKIKHGSNLEIAYFDQLRQTLDPEKTVLENVGDGREFINVNGKDRHIISYLADFLFTAARVRSPAKSLSGGERNRLLLAQILARPANLLVLDEPTNDLDIETLEILEQRLVDYTGTLLIVSHDRTFLDNVVTSTIVFENDGKIQEYVGGYDDWLRQSKSVKPNLASEKKAKNTSNSRVNENKSNHKLSYKLQRELDSLPGLIEQLEQTLETLQKETLDTGFYSKDKDLIQNTLKKIETAENELEQSMARWEELESQKASL